MKVRLSEQAQADILRLDEWWQAHREKNPLLFREELRVALDHIEASPTNASTYRSRRTGKSYLKVPLLKTRNTIYYEYFPNDERVDVVTIQSPVAGEPDI